MPGNIKQTSTKHPAYRSKSTLSTHTYTYRSTDATVYRHNATAGLASYEHFFANASTANPATDPQLQQYCGSCSSKMRIGARPRPAFAFRFSAPNDAIILPPPNPAMHRPPILTFFFRFTTALFHSRDVIAACIFYETSAHPSLSSHPSIHPRWIHRRL